MSVFVPRNRIVSIRLSDQEFQSLHDLCLREGARSLSDIARSAVQAFLEMRTRRREETLDATVQALGLRIDALEQSLRELIRVIRQNKTSLSV